MKQILLLLTALLLHFISLAQPQKTLSLDEAISRSLDASTQIKISESKTQQAALALQEAKEKRLPDFTVSGSYLRLQQPNVDLKLRLGGSAPQASGDANTQSSVTINQAAYGIANISLPLFSGFQIKHGIETASLLKKVTQLDGEKDKEAVIANTIAAYSNLYKATMALHVVQENLKQSQSRLKDFSRQEENGLLARNDLLKAQLQQSNIELTLLDAENNLKLAAINLNLLLGFDENTTLVPDSASFLKNADDKTYTDWETTALQNRADIQALDYRKKAAQTNIEAAKGAYFPSVALTGGYIAAYVPNFLTLTNALNAGVGLRYAPSSLWKAGTKVKEAKAKAEEVALNQDLMTDAIRLQVANAYQAFQSSNKKIEVYEKALEQARENYRIINNKYDNALATTTDLLEADVAQLQATLNYAFSKADAAVAFKNLQQSAGILSASFKK